MKSVNYSFNSSLLVDFMLLWHLKMEASQPPANQGPHTDAQVLAEADDATHSLRPRDKLPLYLAGSKEIYWRAERDISQWLTLLGRGPAVSGLESESVKNALRMHCLGVTCPSPEMMKTLWARSCFGVHATVHARLHLLF